MDRGAWWATVHGVTKTEWLHFPFSLSCIGEGNANPLQCSCLENPRDRGAGAAVYGVAQSQTQQTRLSSSSHKRNLVANSLQDRKESDTSECLTLSKQKERCLIPSIQATSFLHLWWNIKMFQIISTTWSDLTQNFFKSQDWRHPQISGRLLQGCFLTPPKLEVPGLQARLLILPDKSVSSLLFFSRSVVSDSVSS